MNNCKYKITTLLLTASLLLVGMPVLTGDVPRSLSGIESLRTLSEGSASKLTEAVMKNGLRIIVDERTGSTTAHCSIIVGIGSRYEPEGLNGISHLMEHLLFRDEWLPPYNNEEQISCPNRKEILNQISSAGGILNGTTTFEYTRYYLTAPASAFEPVFEGLGKLVLEPCFNRRGVNLEKKIILQEIALTKNNPLAIAYYSLIDRVIPDDPLGRPIAGTTLSLKTISFDKINELYQTYYVPNNMTVVIVGGVDTEIALRKVEETFSNMEERPLPDKPFSTPKFSPPKSPFYSPFNKGGEGDLGGKRGIKLKTLTKQGFFALIVRTDGGQDKGKHAMRLLYSILGPGKNSRLYRKLKDEGLSDFFITVENFGSLELASLSDIGIWGFVVATSPDNLKRVEKIVLSEIEKVKSTSVSEEELSIAKSETIGKLKIDFESNEVRASVYGHWSVSGSSGRTDRNVCPTIDAFLQEIEKISAEQIILAAQEHFQDDRLITFTIMPAKGLGIIWAVIKFLLFKRV